MRGEAVTHDGNQLGMYFVLVLLVILAMYICV